jgi:cell shape-determining protein MreD
MTAPRLAIVALLACALAADAALGVLSPAVARPPLMLLAVVAGVALSGGIRAGMVTGFGVGLVLDLLSGPESLAGVHALTALTVGAAAGVVRRHAGGRTRWQSPYGVRPPSQSMLTVAVVTGALAVAGAAMLSVALHRLVGSDIGYLTSGIVAQALAAGSGVTPITHRAVRRLAVRPLVQR